MGIPSNSLLPYKFDDSTSLRALLALGGPSFGASENEFAPQLGYIEDYVRKLGCTSLLIESHYIDRDFIEDFSLFYSRSLFPYPNSCRRVHFFRLPVEALPDAVLGLELQIVGTGSQSANSAYLGFCVIKPLPGSPVGRTVLQPYSATPEDEVSEIREFPAVRDYSVHLGLRALHVTGLPFQQQDVGVSACATTALWVSLNQLRAFEEFGTATPAQITTLATKFSLPFGRPIPSEDGLSLDQMCQALQALRVSPSLLLTDTTDRAMAYIYYSLRSAFSPILILQRRSDPNLWHAVAGAGMRRRKPLDPPPGTVVRRADEMAYLYLHDDRLGPYVKAKLVSDARRPVLSVTKRSGPPEEWNINYVLLALHQKIHLSVSSLDRIAQRTLRILKSTLATQSKTSSQGTIGVAYECWFSKPHTYFNSILGTPRGPSLARRALSQCALPRYLGVVRLQIGARAVVDLLVDSTSTMKNLHFVAVCARLPESLSEIAENLAREADCPAFVEPL